MVPKLEMGAEIHSLKTIRGRKQVMREPNINFGKIFSCIDLIFTNQRNIVMESGIHSTSHSKYHHQKVSLKLN